MDVYPKILYRENEITLGHPRWRCALLTQEPGGCVAHVVGTGWGDTQKEALKEAMKFAEEALAMVKQQAMLEEPRNEA